MTPLEAEGLSEERLAEVLAAAVRARAPALPEALARSTNKAVARAAKKALYQLRSSGVAVAAEAPKGEQPKLERASADEPALLSAIAGTGERAIFFVKPRQGGGLETSQAITHDELGIVELQRGESSRSSWRRHLAEVRADPAAILEVPVARALEELGVAWAVNVRAREPLPRDADSALRRLGVQPIEAWPPLPAPQPAEAALTVRAGALHDEPEVRSWLPGGRHIRLLVARLDELKTSVLQLTEQQKAEQRAQKVQLTASELTAEERRIWAFRLWRTAELFEKSGRDEQGRIARAEARLLAHGAATPSRFVEGLFEKVLRLSQQALANPAGPQGEAAAPAPPPAAKTRAGGIIMP